MTLKDILTEANARKGVRFCFGGLRGEAEMVVVFGRCGFVHSTTNPLILLRDEPSIEAWINLPVTVLDAPDDAGAPDDATADDLVTVEATVAIDEYGDYFVIGADYLDAEDRQRRLLSEGPAEACRSKVSFVPLLVRIRPPHVTVTPAEVVSTERKDTLDAD